MTNPAINLNNLVADMLSTADEFQARAESDAAIPVLSGAPWCVTTKDGSFAILVEDNEDGTINMVPKYVRPHLCGFSCLTRRDAETVAAHFPELYQVTAVNALASIRAASLRECAEATLEMMAA